MTGRTDESMFRSPLFSPGAETRVEIGGQTPLVYCWKDDIVLAINVALATRRSLLVRGEPGIGKSTIAEAAAAALDWRFYRYTITSRTEAQDLTWRFDHVRRLAEAQALSYSGRGAHDELKYLLPGPFWWAFDPRSAAARGNPEQRAFDVADPFPANKSRRLEGAVVLIDEIDKADPAVANDLLETLSETRFRIDVLAEPLEVRWSFGNVRPPAGGLLIIFTSNEERDLPLAFMRRCATITMSWPDAYSSPEKIEFDQFVKDVARKNWERVSAGSPADPHSAEANELLDQLLRLIWVQRKELIERNERPPGLSEFLDAVATARELSISPSSSKWKEIERIVWRKQYE
jgi:MoxR-like ATPase